MSSAHSDRNLLFGILALQMDFISRDALIAAMQAWVLERSKSLGEILVEQGAMADDDADWRPTGFHSNLFGCETSIRFPAVKLLDFMAHEAILEASDNPFAQVVLAHLKGRQTQSDPAGRHAWKVRLVRNLYERGFSPKDVRELFRVIDWLMELPPPLQDVFWQDVDKIQEERRMPYITSVQRVGRREGMREGIEVALRIRFGDEGVKLMPEIREIHEEETLRAILKALETAASPDEVRRLWSPPAS